MAIVAYVGRPRSGKSYGVVENVILPALKSGRTIVTNIPLKVGRLNDDFPKGKIVQFQPKDPLEDDSFWDLDNHAGCIWVIDECWRYWKSGTTAKNIPELQQRFFTEHGHCVGDDGRTTEIVLVTQSLDQLASFVRTLVEETFRATKLSSLGQKNKYRVDAFTGAQKGLEGGKPTRQLFGKYKSEVYQYYTSHTNNKTDFAAGMEEKVDGRNNIFKSPLFWLGIPVLLAVALAAASSLSSYFMRGDPEPDQSATQQSLETNVITVTESEYQVMQIQAESSRIERARQAMLDLDVTREYLPVSETYRIVGHINHKYMVWSDSGTRYIPEHLCSEYSSTNEPYCVLNGELVTWYSSSIPVVSQDYRDYGVGNSLPSVDDVL